MELQLPRAALYVRRIYMNNGREVDSEVEEGEAPMSEAQQDQYKAVIGDAQARVSVGRDMSEMDYGSGGKVFISVSLVCDQSQAGISYAVGLAAQMADYFVEQHYQQMRSRCHAIGLLEQPHTNGRPQY